jgi:hypothetical protein
LAAALAQASRLAVWNSGACFMVFSGRSGPVYRIYNY